MATAPATIFRPRTIRFDQPAKAKAALVAVAFVATFWNLLDFIPPFGRLVHAWVYELDWSHGPLIPLFSAYLIYLKWDQIRTCPIRFAWVGAPLMLGGLLLFVAALSGVVKFAYAQDLSMMITLLGVIILLCGLPVLWHAWVPWLYLFFAIPMPQRIYVALTDPLRRMAATVASTVLELIPGLEAERVGSNLEFWYEGQRHQIGVADACSGMRSTVTLCAVGVAVAFMSARPWWQRLILIAACVPIATFCNFIRVTVTCWLTVFVDPKYAHGTYHMMLGLAVILLAFGIFSGIAWVLDHLFVDEPEAESPAA